MLKDKLEEPGFLESLRYNGSFINYLVFLCVVMMICLLWFEYTLMKALYNEAGDKMTRSTGYQAQMVDRHLEEARVQLKQLDNMVEQGKGADADWIESYPWDVNNLVQFDLAGAVSVNGRTRYGRELPPASLANLKDSFRGYDQVLFYPAGGILPEEDGLLISAPIWRDNKVAGAVYGVLAGPRLSAFIGYGGLTGGTSLCVYKNFTRVIRGPEHNQDTAQVVQGFLKGYDRDVLDNLYRQLYYHGFGVERFKYAGHGYYIAATSLKKMEGWHIVSLVPSEEIDTGIGKIIAMTIAAYLILSLMFLASFFALANLEWKRRKQISRLAYYDELTGLPNLERFNLVLKERPELEAVYVVLDINNFSQLNNIMGYSYGNRVLKKVAQVLKEHLEESELLCRVRGDRFGLCVGRKTREELQQRAEAAMAKVVESVLGYQLTLACGIDLPSEGKPSRIEHSLEALKAAKKQRGNKVCFYDEQLAKEQQKRLAVENDFQKALVRGDFKVFLQAKFSVVDNRWVGSEALCRWFHPELGFISPGYFIPILEDTGQIVQLDMYMLEECCKIVRRWLDAGQTALPVSVNLSRVHCESKALVQNVTGLIQKYQLPKRYLELEITERAFAKDNKIVWDKLKCLHDQGFHILVDDFGTGYSNLASLDNIPAAVIKLDKSFVDTWQTEGDSTLITDIVTMARHAGVTVLIEGVETRAQCEMVRQAGCEVVQGYYFAKPAAVDDYENLIKGGGPV